MSSAFSVQRVGDPVLCVCACKKGRCPDGFVSSGDPRIWVEGAMVALRGDTSTNCCGSCCKCPNFILTGAVRLVRPIARRVDSVSCGVFTGGALRTFIGG